LYHAKETLGWQRETPYDAIIATAGAPEVPEGLVDQLVIGGRRLVIPVGSHPQQELCRMTRCKNGNEIETMGACRFVSLVGRRA
jgi:protein-L-isoaspartate(D-aspartate) O-methyltransferase